MNEGGCDPDGRFYCGSMAYDQRPGAASVYRLDPDLTVHVVLEGVTVSNGLDWSPDGALAYYNDTATHSIAVFDYDRDAGPTDRRVFVEMEHRPDGLTVDSEGASGRRSPTAGRSAATTPTGSSARSSSCPRARSRPARSAASASTSCSSPPRARAWSRGRTRSPARCSGPRPG
jgi:sugar lactone lactonase YvrE